MEGTTFMGNDECVAQIGKKHPNIYKINFMIVFQIRFLKHLKALGSTVILLPMYLLIILFFGLGNGFYTDVYEFWLPLLLITFLPVVFLHLEYLYFNAGTKVYVDSREKCFIYSKRNKKITTKFSDINKVVLFMPHSWHRNSNVHFLPFEQYHYAKIITKDGGHFIITCLLAERVEDLLRNFNNITIEKKKRLFASIIIESVWN